MMPPLTAPEIIALALASVAVGVPIVWLLRHPRVLLWLCIYGAVGLAALVALAGLFGP